MPLAEFVAAAGDGLYPEGDFDDAGLRRNLARRGFSFDQVRGEEHQSLVRRVGDAGSLASSIAPTSLGAFCTCPLLATGSRWYVHRLAALMRSQRSCPILYGTTSTASLLTRWASFSL